MLRTSLKMTIRLYLFQHFRHSFPSLRDSGFDARFRVAGLGCNFIKRQTLFVPQFQVLPLRVAETGEEFLPQLYGFFGVDSFACSVAVREVRSVYAGDLQFALAVVSDADCLGDFHSQCFHVADLVVRAAELPKFGEGFLDYVFRFGPESGGFCEASGYGQQLWTDAGGDMFKFLFCHHSISHNFIPFRQHKTKSIAPDLAENFCFYPYGSKKREKVKEKPEVFKADGF